MNGHAEMRLRHNNRVVRLQCKQICALISSVNSLADLTHELVSIGFVRGAFSPEIANLQCHLCLLELAQLLSTNGQ